MRNVLALFFAWLAYIYLDEKKYKKSLLWITIATFIHFSAVICYPVWIICLFSDKNMFSIKKAFKYWTFIFILSFLFKFFVSDIMILVSKNYSIYLNQTGMAVNTFVGRSYIIILAIWRFKTLISHNPMNRIMLVVLLVNLLVIPLQSVLPIMYRMLLLAEPAVFFLIPELIRVYSLKKNNYLFAIFVRLSLIFYLIWNIITFFKKNMQSYGLDNYSNILFY
jgi:hypothetical protein